MTEDEERAVIRELCRHVVAVYSLVCDGCGEDVEREDTSEWNFCADLVERGWRAAGGEAGPLCPECVEKGVVP